MTHIKPAVISLGIKGWILWHGMANRPVDHISFINAGTLTVNPAKDPTNPNTARTPQVLSRTSGERPPATACEGQSAIKGIRFHGLHQRNWRPPTPLRAINFTLWWQKVGPVTELPWSLALPSPNLHMDKERVRKNERLDGQKTKTADCWTNI